jgi:hypothetical protein
MFAILAVLFVAGLLSGGCQQIQPPAAEVAPELKVIVAMPGFFANRWKDHPNDFRDWWPDRDRQIDVIILNVSNHPIDVYDRWSRSGYQDVRLEWQADGKSGTVSVVPLVEIAWNFPSLTTLDPGGAIVRSVAIDKDWKGWPAFRVGMVLTLRAVYQVPPASKDDLISDPRYEGAPLPGWSGKVTSAPLTLTIYE